MLEAMGELMNRAERQTRQLIEQIPDGTYRGEAFVDSDGVVDEPLKIAIVPGRTLAMTGWANWPNDANRCRPMSSPNSMPAVSSWPRPKPG